MDGEMMERVYGAGFTIVGLSHLVQARLWADLFAQVGRSRFGALLIGTFTLPLGLLTVSLHNVWVADVRVLVTVIGWGMVIKSAAYLLVPSAGARVVRSGSSHPAKFAAVGAVMACLGLALSAEAFL